MFDGDALLYAMEAGIYEPLAKSGEDVKTGQPAARIHIPETPGMPPIELAFEQDGMILAHRIPARVERGDCLFHIAVETSWSM
jgi:predicted deacylase